MAGRRGEVALVNVLGVAALALVACSEIVAPPLPAGAVRIDPLPVYAEWWKMTQQCSALTGDFSRIEWYVVPSATSFPNGNLRVQGLWQDGRIIIAGLFQRDGALVRHEMLHALLNKGGHARADFVGRCGLVVACEGNCPDELDAPPAAPDAVLVTPSQLEVTTDVSPAAPTDAQFGGWFRMAISVRNPLAQPVTVQLPDAGDVGPPVAFQYDYTQNGFGVRFDGRASFAEMTRFGPGETKRKIFDFWIEPVVGPPLLGIYEFRGGYGDHWAAPMSVTITP